MFSNQILVETSVDRKFTPGKSHPHVWAELVPRVSLTVYKSTVREQAFEGRQETTDLMDF